MPFGTGFSNWRPNVTRFWFCCEQPRTFKLTSSIREGRAVMPSAALQSGAGSVTVSDFAQRYRVGEDKIRAWIARGELRAINTAATLAGRPRWVIPPEAVKEFEAKRMGGVVSAPARNRRRRVDTE